MFATLFTLVTLFTFATAQNSNIKPDFSVDTPEFVQCQNSKLKLPTSGNSYSVWIVKPNDFCGTPIVDLGEQDKTKTWKVALPAGMQVQVSLQDANSNEGWSNIVTVKPSNDSSCVPPTLLQSFKATQASLTNNALTPVRTTLVVSPSAAPPPPKPVGAANAGSNPLKANGAPSLHQVSASVMIMTSIATLAMFSL